jgi:hypothetical protein
MSSFVPVQNNMDIDDELVNNQYSASQQAPKSLSTAKQLSQMTKETLPQSFRRSRLKNMIFLSKQKSRLIDGNYCMTTQGGVMQETWRRKVAVRSQPSFLFFFFLHLLFYYFY